MMPAPPDFSQYTAEDLFRHVEQFNARTLPKEAWTHHGHLLVAIDYCLQYEVETALDLLRGRIAAYNESVGGMNTDEDGYHETLTKFWLIVARKFIAAHPELDGLALCKAFCTAAEGDKNYPFQYYSSGHLFSVQARRTWVEPDLKVLEEA